ncbi:hypothetical protein ACMFMF_010116 [Clarireedia jacksonii]
MNRINFHRIARFNSGVQPQRLNDSTAFGSFDVKFRCCLHIFETYEYLGLRKSSNAISGNKTVLRSFFPVVGLSRLKFSPLLHLPSSNSHSFHRYPPTALSNAALYTTGIRKPLNLHEDPNLEA